VDQLLIRFEALTGWTLLQDHPWAGDLELVPLATQRLHQDAQVQRAAAAHGVSERRIGGLDPEGDVALQLLVQSVAELARGDELPLPSREGRVVDYHVDRDRRLLDRDPLQSLGVIDRREGLADLDALEPRQGDDVTRLGV